MLPLHAALLMYGLRRGFTYRAPSATRQVLHTPFLYLQQTCHTRPTIVRGAPIDGVRETMGVRFFAPLQGLVQRVS